MTPHTDVELQADLAKTPGGPIIWSVKETCEVMGIGKTKLYALIRAGLIRAVKLGRNTKIYADSVHQYLKSLPGVRKREEAIMARRRNRTRHKP